MCVTVCFAPREIHKHFIQRTIPMLLFIVGFLYLFVVNMYVSNIAMCCKYFGIFLDITILFYFPSVKVVLIIILALYNFVTSIDIGQRQEHTENIFSVCVFHYI